jgi:hypothetical protein
MRKSTALPLPFSILATAVCKKPTFRTTDLDTTIVNAKGSTRVERFHPARGSEVRLLLSLSDRQFRSRKQRGASGASGRGECATALCSIRCCRLSAPIYPQATLSRIFKRWMMPARV